MVIGENRNDLGISSSKIKEDARKIESSSNLNQRRRRKKKRSFGRLEVKSWANLAMDWFVYL